MDTIFNKIDNYSHSFLGFNPFGVFQNISTWRKYIFILTSFSVLCWLVFGWEATWMQPFTFIKNIPSLLLSQSTFSQIQLEASQFYGIGQHLSSAVIYGIFFILLSIHFEKFNIKKSLNFMLTVSLSFMCVGVYEIIYNILYSNLQNQPWTFTLAWKQGLNISMFTFFVVIGIVSLLYLYSLNLKPNIGKLTIFLFLGSILTYILWVFYPFQTTSLTIGTWTSTNLFPQTMYAVGPINGIALGEPYFVQNNFLHFINILNKVFMSFTILSLAMIRRK